MLVKQRKGKEEGAPSPMSQEGKVGKGRYWYAPICSEPYSRNASQAWAAFAANLKQPEGCRYDILLYKDPF